MIMHPIKGLAPLAIEVPSMVVTMKEILMRLHAFHRNF